MSIDFLPTLVGRVLSFSPSILVMVHRQITEMAQKSTNVQGGPPGQAHLNKSKLTKVQTNPRSHQ